MKLAISILLFVNCLNYQSTSGKIIDFRKLKQVIEVKLDAVRVDKDHVFGLVVEHDEAHSTTLTRKYDKVGRDSHGCVISGDRRSRFRKDLPDIGKFRSINGPGIARRLLGPPLSVRYGVEKSLSELDTEAIRNCEYDVCHTWRCFTVKQNCVHAVEIEIWFRLNFSVKASLENAVLTELQALEREDNRVRCTGVCIFHGISTPLTEDVRASILESEVKEDSPKPPSEK